MILATSSPFRRDLFRALFPGLFASEEETFLSPDIDEKAVRDPDPDKMVQDIADAKMELGARGKLAGRDGDPDLVVTCDQVTPRT